MLKKQIISFFFTGILNTLFGYSIYSLGILVGFNYIVSIVFATIIGILFNFFTISNYVFYFNKKLLPKFFIGYFIILLFNILITTIVKSYIVYNDYIAGFLGVCCTAILSFLINKIYVYKI